MDAAINKPIYTIDDRNDITVHGEGDESTPALPQFRSQTALGALTEDWPSSRLLDIWSRLPGVTPVKKFTNRQSAIRRIWNALQRPATTQDRPQVAKPKATRANARKKQVSLKPPGSKSEAVLGLLRQPGGATLKALMTATGWQAHSVRGFLSGQVTKKMRLKVKSFKRDGQRVYSVRS